MILSVPVMGAGVFAITYVHDDQPSPGQRHSRIHLHFKRALTWAYGAAMHQSSVFSFKIKFQNFELVIVNI